MDRARFRRGFFLLTALLLAGCAASSAQRVQRELAPWKQVEIGSVRLWTPASFAPVTRDPLTVYFPQGDAHRLPWIGVALLPAAFTQTSAAKLLASLSPARDGEEIRLAAGEATIAGQRCPGWAVRDEQTRGWVYLLRRGDRVVGAIAVAAPAWWPAARAQAFCDAVLDGVRLTPSPDAD